MLNKRFSNAGLVDKKEMKRLSILFVLFLMGCVGIPENVRPVENFNIEKYLGKWYEIARLENNGVRPTQPVAQSRYSTGIKLTNGVGPR